MYYLEALQLPNIYLQIEFVYPRIIFVQASWTKEIRYCSKLIAVYGKSHAKANYQR